MSRFLAVAILAVFALVFTGCRHHRHHNHYITVPGDSSSNPGNANGHEEGCSCHSCDKKGTGHEKNADKPGHQKHGDDPN